MKRNRVIEDPVEAIIAKALDDIGMSYRRDDPLDFECVDFAIECKQFYTDRIHKQIENRRNVIVIQGIEAAKAFAYMIAGRP